MAEKKLPMFYTEEHIHNFHNMSVEIARDYDDVLTELYVKSTKLSNERASEFLRHGVLRRLQILKRCIDNIFKLFDPTQREKLDKHTLLDVTINLQSFFINIAGIQDNIAFVIAHDKGIFPINRKGKTILNKVTLEDKTIQSLLSKEMVSIINGGRFSEWKKQYSKVYRDALAHRIPLYIAPAVYTEEDEKKYNGLESEYDQLDIYKSDDEFRRAKEIQDEMDAIGSASYLFSHSPSDDGKPIYLHPQTLSDMGFILELLICFKDTCLGDISNK